MALGRPAIPTPNQLLLRPVQEAVSSARQRIEAIEALVSTLQSGAAASTSAVTLASLQAQISQLRGTVTSLLGVVAGNVVTLRADAAIVAYDVVYPTSDGGVSPMDPSSPTGVYAPIGVATIGAALGASVTVQTYGELGIPTASFVVHRAVYADIGGGLTQNPSYLDVAIPIGVAVDTKKLYVAPDWPALRVAGFDPGFEDFLPVTYGAVKDALALLSSLLSSPDGLVVKVGSSLITRTLQGSDGIAITYPDGVSGNPTFTLNSTMHPGAAALALAGLAPTISVAFVPGAGALTLTGLAPTVS
jgi:hypothetical protein